VVTHPSEEDLPSTVEYLVEDERMTINMIELHVHPSGCVTNFPSQYGNDITRTEPEALSSTAEMTEGYPFTF